MQGLVASTCGHPSFAAQSSGTVQAAPTLGAVAGPPAGGAAPHWDMDATQISEAAQSLTPPTIGPTVWQYPFFSVHFPDTHVPESPQSSGPPVFLGGLHVPKGRHFLETEPQYWVAMQSEDVEQVIPVVLK